MTDPVLVLCLRFVISSQTASKSYLSKSNVCCNQSNVVCLLNLALETLVLLHALCMETWMRDGFESKCVFQLSYVL